MAEPLALTATYMKKQFSGLPGDNLLDALANPAASAVTAKTSSETHAHTVATNATSPRVVAYLNRHGDRLKDFADQASYYRIAPAPVPAVIP